MNRTRLTTTLTAFAAATLVAITGCGSTVAGSAGAATTLTTSSATSTTEEVPTETAPSETADATTESVEPSSDSESVSSTSTSETDSEWTNDASDLDAASVTWISTFCYGFADVAQYIGPDTTGMSKSDTISAVVKGYGSMADAATTAVGTLAKVAEPDFQGHETVTPAVIDWFTSVSTVYGQGSESIANGTYAGPNDLRDAINAIEAEMSGANDDLGAAIGTIDPSVSATIVSLPECEALASGH